MGNGETCPRYKGQGFTLKKHIQEIKCCLVSQIMEGLGKNSDDVAFRAIFRNRT